MRHLLLPALAAGLLLAAAGRAADPADARAILDRAAQAHGGLDKLSALRADRVKAKGVVFLNKSKIPFTAETSIQLPNQFRNVMRFEVNGKPRTLTQILNGDQGWVTDDGKVLTPDAKALNNMKEMIYLDNVVRLAPLLKEKGFDLKTLPETKVNDRPAVGVRVASKGHKDVDLYFDRKTSLLVKTVHPVVNAEGKEVQQEEYYSDHRETNGCKRPMKVVAYQDGVKSMEGELTEVKYLDRIDPREFARPEPARP